MNEKLVVVFAGPNGSGKSTVVDNALALNQCPKTFICPDNYVAAEDKDDAEAIKAAMRKAEAVRHSELANGNSFSFETVLSMPDKLEFIRYAQWQGYTVHVVYVTTEDPEINIERVKTRVAQGGHDVPEDKLRARYERSMNLMFDVIREADRVDFYDNSGNTPRFVAMKNDIAICTCDDVPAWLETYVLSKARERGIMVTSLVPV